MNTPIRDDVWIIQGALYAAQRSQDGAIARQATEALAALNTLVRSRRNAIATAHRLREERDQARRASPTHRD